MHLQFVKRWEGKKNPLQILSVYENIKRNVGETVKDYCVRFNALYNSLPTHIKPLEGLSLVNFPDVFETDMAYKLREHDPTTLVEMQNNVVGVESNLLAKRERMRSENRVTIKEDTSNFDAKMDSLLRTMERMVDQFSISDGPKPQI